jgi:hypothetical protein
MNQGAAAGEAPFVTNSEIAARDAQREYDDAQRHLDSIVERMLSLGATPSNHGLLLSMVGKDKDEIKERQNLQGVYDEARTNTIHLSNAALTARETANRDNNPNANRGPGPYDHLSLEELAETMLGGRKNRKSVHNKKNRRSYKKRRSYKNRRSYKKRGARMTKYKLSKKY